MAFVLCMHQRQKTDYSTCPEVLGLTSRLARIMLWTRPLFGILEQIICSGQRDDDLQKWKQTVLFSSQRITSCFYSTFGSALSNIKIHEWRDSFCNSYGQKNRCYSAFSLIISSQSFSYRIQSLPWETIWKGMDEQLPGYFGLLGNLWIFPLSKNISKLPVFLTYQKHSF